MENYFKQDFYPVHKLAEALQAKENQKDVYASLNTYIGKKRRVATLKKINAVYVDLDVYNKNLTKAQALVWLHEEYYDKIIPAPTYVIDSGRGLYLIWKLKNEDRNALPR